MRDNGGIHDGSFFRAVVLKGRKLGRYRRKPLSFGTLAPSDTGKSFLFTWFFIIEYFIKVLSSKAFIAEARPCW